MSCVTDFTHPKKERRRMLAQRQTLFFCFIVAWLAVAQQVDASYYYYYYDWPTVPTVPPPTTKAPTTKAPTTKAPTTKAPTISSPTTRAPTTRAPTTRAPTTRAPTRIPTQLPPSTPAPTLKPTTRSPTAVGITPKPTSRSPTLLPTTRAPTKLPTLLPTAKPSTRSPTRLPTVAPTVTTPSGGNYQITLRFPSPVPTSVLSVFNQAKAKWESVITNDLGNSAQINAGEYGCDSSEAWTRETSTVVFDDLLIYARIAAIDGVGSVLGAAGPCRTSSNPLYPRTGIMDFDSADVNSMLQDGSLYSVILHEMGHVLGIGTFWDGNGYNLLQNSGSNILYRGVNGNEGNVNIGFTGQAIVENTGGSGTAGGHWKDTTYGNELMTGYLSPGNNPMSLLTIKSLRDMSYSVDVSKADAYTRPSGRRLRGGEGKHPYGNDIKIIRNAKPVTCIPRRKKNKGL